jgi:hypothetical protein
VTFDDLQDQTVIPNGYAQLNWSGFEVITAIGDGYTSGIISPPNAAFNPYGYDATISSSNRFNLISAYLTAAVVPQIQVQVEGWVGTELVYDQTYTLNESKPTLVTFNYAGVTEVTFIGEDGSPFVMDNLLVSSPTFTNGTSPVDLGQVQVSTIGHVPPIFTPNIVTDYLVDESQEAGGGAILPTVSADFDTNNRFRLTVAAPPGLQFVVHVPAGKSVYLNAFLDWQGLDVLSNGLNVFGTTAVSFGGLNGSAPGFSAQSAVLSQRHGYFGFDVQSLAITNDFSFASVTLTATVPDTNVGSGLLTYEPSVGNILVFDYVTAQISDPGRFVSLAPASPTPVGPELLGVSIAREPNGDVTITFKGILQSANQVAGPFTDVPGSPVGTYTIPKATLNTQQHFRARQ